MTIFKCKMCGGELEINNNETVATCIYCRSQQTLPRLDDERRMNLYDRANHFRRNNEFDKAMGIYEQILNEDNTDAEAYWSIVLCRYGIEYVEDSASHKRIPTINRAQYTSIFDDNNYKSALQYADVYQRNIYEEEANYINEIQKAILDISQKEEPFDVFICYKETDNEGRRTPDSVLANELYHQLTQEGFKVFFSRITLEDKLGTAYEPYIFAALNSAKAMVVLGTKPEFFKAVWVRNEWSRYLSLIKQGQKKVLIPAYKDMDPYDLPEEFSHLQAQDMSKLGFMQDLIRGIKKIIHTDTPKVNVVNETVVTGTTANVASLLRRVNIFLEDGDWNSANEYCEKVLDIEPENAMAYLGKLMSELHVRKREHLKDCAEPFDGNGNYRKAMRFGDDKLSKELGDCVVYINNRNKYNYAKNAMLSANTEDAYKNAAHLFEIIGNYMDAPTFAQECYDKAEIVRKDVILAEGNMKMNLDCISGYESAMKLFESISGWKDADEKIHECKRKIEEIKAKTEVERLECERKAKHNKIIRKKITVSVVAICCIVAVIILVINVFIPKVIVPIIESNNATQKKNDFISVYGEDVYNKFGIVEEGGYITFGKYEQDNDTSNGKEDVEWLVLEVTDGKALLISRYAFEKMKYDSGDTPVTWETSDMREWLNNDFINLIFSEEDEKEILTVTVTADKNPQYGTEAGNATEDKVFLLSSIEAERYFDSDSERQCHYISNYSGTMFYSDDDFVSWRLRSPGQYGGSAVVESDGEISNVGWSEVLSCFTRPALWIDLSN